MPDKIITEEQKEIIRMLTNMSNGVSNSVWMAENNEDSDVNEKIEQAIWYAEFLLDSIRKIKMHSANNTIQTGQ